MEKIHAEADILQIETSGIEDDNGLRNSSQNSDFSVSTREKWNKVKNDSSVATISSVTLRQDNTSPLTLIRHEQMHKENRSIKNANVEEFDIVQKKKSENQIRAEFTKELVRQKNEGMCTFNSGYDASQENSPENLKNRMFKKSHMEIFLGTRKMNSKSTMTNRTASTISDSPKRRNSSEGSKIKKSEIENQKHLQFPNISNRGEQFMDTDNSDDSETQDRRKTDDSLILTCTSHQDTQQQQFDKKIKKASRFISNRRSLKKKPPQAKPTNHDSEKENLKGKLPPLFWSKYDPDISNSDDDNFSPRERVKQRKTKKKKTDSRSYGQIPWQYEEEKQINQDLNSGDSDREDLSRKQQNLNSVDIPTPRYRQSSRESTSALKSSLNLENIQERTLLCPACKKYFDEENRIPYVLPCLHTCCSSCLKERVTDESAVCPQCQEKHMVPNGEIKPFPKDNAKKHLINCYRVQKNISDIKCDQCTGKSSKAAYRCKECDEFLCQVCMDAHKRTKVTKRHNVISTDALKASPFEEFHYKQKCTVPGHDDQPFMFYCYSRTCDKPICTLCAVRDHNQANGHDIRNINDVYVENKRQVEALVVDIKHKKSAADEGIANIEDEIQNLYLKESSIDDNVDTAFEICQKAIEKRRQELKKRLSTVSRRKKKSLELQLDSLVVQRNNLDYACRFPMDVLSYSCATEFLQLKDTLLTRLGRLKLQPLDTVPHNSADIKFQSQRMGDEFQNYVTMVGGIWATSAYLPNTKIQTRDIVVGKEGVVIIITFYDFEKIPLEEEGVDIRVEVIDSQGRRTTASVDDFIATEGCYKAMITPTRAGDYKAMVSVMGTLMHEDGFLFHVHSHDQQENMINADDDVPRLLKHEVTIVDSGTFLKSKNKPRLMHKIGDIFCPEFHFDIASVHAQNEVTDNGRMLTNQKPKGSGKGYSNGLQYYRGVLGSRPFSKIGQYYFEIVANFFIKRSLRQDLIFEVALCRRGDVDKNYSVDSNKYAWAMCARRCPLCRTVCLQAWNNGQRLFHTPITENDPPGTSLKTTIGFLLNIKTKTWFIVDVKNRKGIYKFKNLEVSRPLWPVFGVYNPDLTNVTLRLRCGKEITAVPDVLMDGSYSGRN